MKKFNRFISLTLVLCVAVLTTLTAISSIAYGEVTYYVTVDGAGIMDGSSWEDAARDLKGLIDSLNGNADIWVAKGEYSPGTDDEDTFSLKKGIKIYGGFDGTESVLEDRDIRKNAVLLNGGYISRSVAVVTARSGASTEDTLLDGLTITGGANTNNGGGLFVETGSNLLITECIFLNNTSYSAGGGIYNYYSSPFIQNCTFSGNNAIKGNGGAVYNNNSSSTLENCSFRRNEAIYGGGLFNFNSTIVVGYSTFSDNRSFNRGGGMSNYDSTVVVTDCVLNGNCGEEFGGGMHNENSSAEIKNCDFLNNNSNPGNGGGISNVKSSVEISECRFTKNEAYYSGGGLANENSSLKVFSCIFSDNKATRTGGGGIVNLGGSLTIENSHFYNNAARDGQDIYNRDSSPVIENSVFYGGEITDLINDEGDNSKTVLINCIISSADSIPF